MITDLRFLAYITAQIDTITTVQGIMLAVARVNWEGEAESKRLSIFDSWKYQYGVDWTEPDL